MARVVIYSLQGQQAGDIEFVFSRDGQGSYLFVDIDANYAATFQMQPGRIFNARGKHLADLVCGSNGKEAFGNVHPPGRRNPYWGTITNSGAEVVDRNGTHNLGRVSQNQVIRTGRGKVGEVSLNWTTEDESFFTEMMNMFVKYNGIPGDRAETLIARLRKVAQQTILTLAGGSALIMKLLE